MARDYLHLRANPEVQLTLTLDYFTRHIKKLATEEHQGYVEANLFQPGLITNLDDTKPFLSMLDTFTSEGLKYFNQESQYSETSIFFIKMNYMVSQYLALNKNPDGVKRLQNLQLQLEQQLKITTKPDITCRIHQYLFLSIVNQIDLSEDTLQEELLAKAYASFHYIQSRANPQTGDHARDELHLDKGIAKFRMWLNKLAKNNKDKVLEVINPILTKPKGKELKSYSYPICIFGEGKQAETLNMLDGVFIQESYAQIWCMTN